MFADAACRSSALFESKRQTAITKQGVLGETPSECSQPAVQRVHGCKRPPKMGEEASSFAVHECLAMTIFRRATGTPHV